MKNSFIKMLISGVLLFAISMLTSCSTNNKLLDLSSEVTEPKQFSFITDKDKYSEKDVVISYTITNTSLEEIAFPTELFELQYKTEKGWKMVSFKKEVIFYDLACVLQPEESSTEEIELEEYFNVPLLLGKYRIVKDSFLSNVFIIE